MDSKRCPDCGETKPLTDFFREARRRDGHAAYCKACKMRTKLARAKVRRATDGGRQTALEREAKRRWRRNNPDAYKAYCKRNNARRDYDKLTVSRYGMTRQDYEDRLAEQGGACAICGKTEITVVVQTKIGELRYRRLSVDHDHTSGAIRGLLCRYCNTGLGGFRDDPELLQRAIEYLATAQTSNPSM